MIDKEKAKMNMKKQWIKFGVVTVSICSSSCG